MPHYDGHPFKIFLSVLALFVQSALVDRGEFLIPNIRQHVIFFIAGMFLFAPACFGEILLRDGLLTVQVEGIGLGSIFEEIGKQGNILIKKESKTLDQKVTIQFGPLPLDKGLKRLLKETNHLATYDQHGNITLLVIDDNRSATSDRPVLPMEAPVNLPAETSQSERQPLAPSEEPENNAAPPDPNAPPPGEVS
jgi:hypothetical protein